jgi:hypothetical protein
MSILDLSLSVLVLSVIALSVIALSVIAREPSGYSDTGMQRRRSKDKV